MKADRTDLLIALVFLAFALIALLVWIPGDIDSGILEKVRRREKMGDALFPTAIAAAMAIVAALSALLSLRGDHDPDRRRPGIGFLAGFIAITALSLIMMRYTGPVTVALADGLGLIEGEYRNLRDTPPWKYLGFVTGGVALVAGLIAQVQGRLTARAIAVGALATLVLIALYDLPFEDLLLPPNGDV